MWVSGIITLFHEGEWSGDMLGHAQGQWQIRGSAYNSS